MQLVDRYIGPLVAIPDALPAHLALGILFALPLTILMAAVSYFFYERPFLYLKKNFTIVPSRLVE